MLNFWSGVLVHVLCWGHFREILFGLLDPKTPGHRSHTEEREINNGRFAMFAAIGIIAAELYTGKDAIEQFGL